MNTEELKIADWWEKTDNDKILCTLCPRYCRIGDGQPGFCFIRQNYGGVLYSLGYGHPSGFAIDPIEKKPLNHFLPGSRVLSFGTAGCNLGCRFCQNWSISKAKLDEMNSFTDTVTFLSWMPLALRISKLFAAKIWTFSKTTFDIMLSGRPVMMPATWGQVAFRLLMWMLR